MRATFAVVLAGMAQAAIASSTEYASDAVRFRLEPLVQGLQQPVAMCFLPDGRALVADRRQPALYLLDVGAKRLLPVAGLPAVLAQEDAGLLDVVPHPDYARNGWLYFSYSAGEPEHSTTVVDRARLDGAVLIDRERVLTANAWSEDRFHYGGRLLVHDGYLYVTIGDRHHPERAQALDTHAGKILRLHDDGRVPADNPQAGGEPGDDLVWSLGHRNPQGLALDAATGLVWSSEHGPRGGDEVNVIRRGANYGWPVVSWGFEYDGGPVGKGIVAQDGMESPVWVWSPAIAPSDLIVYSGRAFPAWKGNLIGGAMGRTHLNRLVVADQRVQLEERLLFAVLGRVRLVEEGPDGAIYVGSDGGGIARIVPASH